MFKSSIISIPNTIKRRQGFIQFISLFGHVGAEKSQNFIFKLFSFVVYIFRKIDKQIAELNKDRKKLILIKTERSNEKWTSDSSSF